MRTAKATSFNIHVHVSVYLPVMLIVGYLHIHVLG